MARWNVRSGWIVRAVSLFFLATSAPCVRAQTPGPAQPPRTFDLAAIDAYVAAHVRDEGYAGLALTIMRDGKIVLAKGYGKRSLEPASPRRARNHVRRRLGDQAVHVRLHPLARRGGQAVDR